MMCSLTQRPRPVSEGSAAATSQQQRRRQLAQKPSLYQRTIPLRRVGSRVDHTGALQSVLSRHGDRRTQFRKASLQSCTKSCMSLSMSALAWSRQSITNRLGQRPLALFRRSFPGRSLMAEPDSPGCLIPSSDHRQRAMMAADQVVSRSHSTLWIVTNPNCPSPKLR
jgi:hypothetical protein